MDKLTKLNAKKVESLETIKGGRLAFSNDLSAEAGPTTEHTPTYKAGADVYLCDHKPDSK